jgi:hypothetical protein
MSPKERSPTQRVARPSASVGRRGTRTGRPALRAAVRLPVETLSTAMILDPGPERLHGHAEAGQEAASPDRADDRVDVRHLLQDLQA